MKKQVTQKGTTWERNPIGAKQLEGLDLHWSTPATKSCTNCPPFSYLPFLEYQRNLLCYDTSPTIGTPPLPVVYHLSYMYVTERKKSRRQTTGMKSIKTSGKVIQNLRMMETLERINPVTLEELKPDITDNPIIDIINSKVHCESNKESSHETNITHVETMIGNDKMMMYGDNPESKDHLNMSFSYFKPEKDVSSFERIQRVPNTAWSMHNECELDNYRFRFN
ncbi:hypothetical protein K501DRAFT_332422 [Backusella circina FSU 941]|nr:hypothetical protein K501DRAFT_332422 [Backusella circina FSU 941]